MKDTIMIAYINISSLLCLGTDESIGKKLDSLFETYIEQMENNNIEKCVVVTYSNEKKSINQKLYNIMFNERTDDRIVFGKRFESGNDIDYYEERYSNDQDISKMYIMSESFNNYNRILPVQYIDINDNDLNIEEQTLYSIFKGNNYRINRIKSNNNILKKSISNN